MIPALHHGWRVLKCCVEERLAGQCVTFGQQLLNRAMISRDTGVRLPHQVGHLRRQDMQPGSSTTGAGGPSTGIASGSRFRA